jgi:hypothetical protein
MTALDVLLLSFAISRSGLDSRAEGRPGQRVVRLGKLDLERHELRDFSKTPMLLQRGYAEMKELVRAELGAVPAQRPAPR